MKFSLMENLISCAVYVSVTLLCMMLKNGQKYEKPFGVNTANFLKLVWSFSTLYMKGLTRKKTTKQNIFPEAAVQKYF